MEEWNAVELLKFKHGVGYANIIFPKKFLNNEITLFAQHRYTSGSEYGNSGQVINITSVQRNSTSQAYVYSYLPDLTIANYKRKTFYQAKGYWK